MSQPEQNIQVQVQVAQPPELTITVDPVQLPIVAAATIGPPGAQGQTGPQGPQGPQGPVGADSTVPGPQGQTGPQGLTGPASIGLLFNYYYEAATSPPSQPNSGAIRADAPLNLATKLWLTDQDNNSLGAANLLANMSQSATVLVQSYNDVTKWSSFTVTNLPVHKSGYIEIGVSPAAQGQPVPPSTPPDSSCIVALAGPTIASGPKGDKGDPGPTGSQGPKGDIGPQGTVPVNDLTQAQYDALAVKDPNTLYVITDSPLPVGPTGPTGPTGATGSQGPAGVQGPPGQDGAVGPQGPAGAGMTLNRQVFTAVGTFSWNKPANAVQTYVAVQAAGGGGGSGRQGLAGSVRSGGGGGGGGGFAESWLDPAALGPTETVVVAAGGLGGAAAGTVDTSGNPGTAASLTKFGTTAFVQPNRGDPGGGGTAGTGAGAAGGGGLFTGGAGGSGSATGAAGANGAGAPLGARASGGGAGGGITTGNATSNGGQGGVLSSRNYFTPSGVAGGSQDGKSDPTTIPGPGTSGGSGGASNLSAPAGKGGDGVLGSGGGGGGCSVNGSASGAGGKGGDGYVIVLTWCTT